MPRLRVAITLGVPSFSLGVRRRFYVTCWGEMPIKPCRSPTAVPLCMCELCVHITAAPALPVLGRETTFPLKSHFFWPWKKQNVCVSCTHLHCTGKCLFWQTRCCWEGNAPCEWDPVCTSLCAPQSASLLYKEKSLSFHLIAKERRSARTVRAQSLLTAKRRFFTLPSKERRGCMASATTLNGMKL